MSVDWELSNNIHPYDHKTELVSENTLNLFIFDFKLIYRTPLKKFGICKIYNYALLQTVKYGFLQINDNILYWLEMCHQIPIWQVGKRKTTPRSFNLKL